MSTLALDYLSKMKIAVMVRQLDLGHILWCGRVVRVKRAHRVRPLRCLIFRGSIPHPTQLLSDHCRQGSRNTRYQAGAAPYLGRTFTGWIAPACDWRTHSITSSARASSVHGMVRPSALAVVRLRTRLNLVGCSTGMLLGFSPRRILSTWSAARRNRSAVRAP